MNNETPLVSICIPTYNAANTILKTLDSILTQTYSNLVIHISDNSSTDDTLKLIDSIDDSRLVIHRHTQNIGGEDNFNRCIEYAEGKYTGIFHADDIYEPTMVARQVAFLESNSEAGAVFTEATLIDDFGKNIGSLKIPKSLLSTPPLYNFPTIFKSILKHSNFLICPSVMVPTTIYKNDIKAWRGKEFGTSADLDVWLRILRNYPISIIHEPLMNYRISANQFSEKLRTRTIRSDFFRVIDYYLAQNWVQEFLTNIDWINFKRLERTDRIVRALNLYLLGREQDSKNLCNDILSIDALYAGISSKRGLITFLLGIALKSFIFFHLPALGKSLLTLLRRCTRK